MDNGPELVAWAVQEWCRLGGAGTIYIEPGSPWQTPWEESFNGRVRDELLNVEEFGSLTEAQVLVEAWRVEYNTYRPHSALDGLTDDAPPCGGEVISGAPDRRAVQPASCSRLVVVAGNTGALWRSRAMEVSER